MREPMPTAPLAKLADVTMGQSPDSAYVNGDKQGLPFLQGSAEFGARFPFARVHCSPALRVARTGATLISVRAPVGTTNRADQDYCIGRGLAAVLAKSGIADDTFLLNAIEQNISYLHRRSQGSTFLAIGSADLNGMPIAAPRLEVQLRIAEIFSTVDEAIAQTETLIDKTRRVKAGLMQDLFTKGVTANGKLRPAREEAPQLYKDSPLGWVADTWEVVPLGEVVPRATYGISASLGTGPGLPVLRMNNICDGEADLSDLKFSNSPLARTLLLRPDDVLFNRTNSIDHVGRTGIWRGQLAEASFASYLVRLEPDSGQLLSEFLNAWLNWDTTQIRIRRFATPGVHQVNINPANLRRTTIALPKQLSEQDTIVQILQSTAATLHGHEAKLQKLRHLKRGLMQDLLTYGLPVSSDVPALIQTTEVGASV